MLIQQILKNLDSLEEALNIQKEREVLNGYNNNDCIDNNIANSGMYTSKK